MPKKCYVCPECNANFLRYPSTVNIPEPSCSRSCAAKSNRGPRNPNFGKRWTEKQRRDLAAKVIKRFEDPAERFRAGSSNRGKKFSQEKIDAMHGHRPASSYSRPVSSQRKAQISKTSKQNWENEEFRQKVIVKGRLTKELKGLVTPLSLLTPWKKYWNLAAWKSSFNYGAVLPGFCRDHIVGRRQGFELGIFPEVLKHPENCQIITLSENSKKARRQPDPQAVDSLFLRIESYDGNYPDHHHVLAFVKRFIAGERWVKE